MQDTILLSTQELLSDWTGFLTVGCTAAAAACGLLSRSLSRRVSALKEEMRTRPMNQSQSIWIETIPSLERAADSMGKAADRFTAASAFFGCLLWWFASNVNEMKAQALNAFEKESTLKLEAAHQGTAKALAEAAAAKENTSHLEVEAARLHEQASLAEAKIKSAEARAAEANERSAMASERAARAERELVEVQERVRPRRYTNAEQARVLQALESVPKGRVIIEARMGDSEGQMLARQIRELLKLSGWLDVTPTISAALGSRTGVSIEYRDLPSVAVPLADALSVDKLRAESSRNSEGPEGVVMIIVGIKPDP